MVVDYCSTDKFNRQRRVHGRGDGMDGGLSVVGHSAPRIYNSHLVTPAHVARRKEKKSTLVAMLRLQLNAYGVCVCSVHIYLSNLVLLSYHFFPTRSLPRSNSPLASASTSRHHCLS